MGCSTAIFKFRNNSCSILRSYHLLDKSRLKYTFRPRNNIRLEKALLRAAKTISDFRPDLRRRIEIYFIDLGTEFGFTHKHMIKLFTKRIKDVETET
jgi:hypothetical protein